MKKTWFKRLLLGIGIFVFVIFLFAGYWLVRGGGRYYFYLPYASQIFLKLAAFETVEAYSNEMLATAEQDHCDWNYGNAIHDANILLGRVALRRGDIKKAKMHLIRAGKTPGSPQLDTFGPSMALARELLERGEQGIVLEYLDLCRAFWEMDRGRLAKWKAEIQHGRVPDFEANL